MKEFVFLIRDKGQGWMNPAILAVFAVMTLIWFSSFFSQIEAFEFLEKSNGVFLKQLLPFCIGLLVLLWGNKFILKRTFLESFTSRQLFSWKKCTISFGVWLGLLLVILLLQWMVHPDHFLFTFESKPFMELLLISLIFVSIQTVFEELLFRSFVLQSIGAVVKNKALIIFFVSLLFTGMHAGNPEIRMVGSWVLIYYFLTSIFLTLLVVLDQGIELTIGFHAANNLFGSLILTNNWQVFQTRALVTDLSPPKINWDIWIILLFLYPVLTFIYVKVTKSNFGSIFDSKIP